MSTYVNQAEVALKKFVESVEKVESRNIEEARAALYESLKLLPQRPVAKVARKTEKSVEEIEAGRKSSSDELVEALLKQQFGSAYLPPSS